MNAAKNAYSDCRVTLYIGVVSVLYPLSVADSYRQTDRNATLQMSHYYPEFNHTHV